MPKEYRERELGSLAQVWIDDEVWQEAWSAYKARIHELIEEAKDRELVDELWRRLKVCDGVRGHIERIKNEGAVAAKAIEFEDKRSKLKRLFG